MGFRPKQNKMDIKKAEEKLKAHIIVKELRDMYMKEKYRNNLTFAGGAVLDIIEGREPKDFDFVEYSSVFEELLVTNKYNFIRETRSAITYQKDSTIIQLLKRGIHEFEYKISQASYDIVIERLSIHIPSYDNKILIPTSFSKEIALDCLYRLPHWNKKGYQIDDITYKSLIDTLNVKNKILPIGDINS